MYMKMEGFKVFENYSERNTERERESVCGAVKEQMQEESRKCR